MSEPKPPTKDGAATGSGRGKRPPRGGVPGTGGANNNTGNNTRGGFKRPGGANQSGNRDSDSQASDASTKRRTGSSSRGRGGAPSGGAGGRRPSRPGSAAAPSPKVGSNPSAPVPTGDDSPALSNLHKVITDLKSMPASQSQGQQSQNAPTPPQQPQQQAQAPQAPTYAQTTQSNLTPTAAPFQPSFIPAEQVPPRHRKAQSMGPTPPGNSANANPSSGYAMSGYAPYLDSMSEDAEVQTSEASLPPMAHFSNRQPMGSFSAPRFSSISSQGGLGGGGNNSDQDLSSSGRPQLAPSFSFGAKRRTNSMSVGPPIGEEDAGFQFPQQNQQQQQQQRERQQEQQQQGQGYGGGVSGPGAQQPHRRTGSEINGIMSQQIAIQNQIEALQQQQQELLQHQLASNQVSHLKHLQSL